MSTEFSPDSLLDQMATLLPLVSCFVNPVKVVFNWKPQTPSCREANDPLSNLMNEGENEWIGARIGVEFEKLFLLDCTPSAVLQIDLIEFSSDSKFR